MKKRISFKIAIVLMSVLCELALLSFFGLSKVSAAPAQQQQLNVAATQGPTSTVWHRGWASTSSPGTTWFYIGSSPVTLVVYNNSCSNRAGSITVQLINTSGVSQGGVVVQCKYPGDTVFNTLRLQARKNYKVIFQFKNTGYAIADYTVSS